MKQLRAITLIFVTLALLAFRPALAQTPPTLTQLQISLWPEYDDPRLLVIVNGTLSEAGQTVSVPIPGGDSALLNAVATADESGQLVNAEYTTTTDEAGNTVITFTPQTSFHVEYYTPIATNADQRIFDFALLPGYFTAEAATLELVLPPDSGAVSTNPVLESSGTGSGGGLLFGRTIKDLTSTAGIEQSVSYSNPTGALTVAEDARVTPAPTPNPTPSGSPSSSARNNTLFIILAVVGVALVIGGIVGIWRTRRSAPPAAPPRTTGAPGGAAQPPPSAGENDRFCRNCGTQFNADDRFCRNCGAARK